MPYKKKLTTLYLILILLLLSANATYFHKVIPLPKDKYFKATILWLIIVYSSIIFISFVCFIILKINYDYDV